MSIDKSVKKIFGTGILMDDVMRCLGGCGVMVQMPAADKQRGRCLRCYQNYLEQAAKEGFCHNCEWPLVGEYEKYRAPDGLCRMCYGVRNDPKMFSLQLWVRGCLA